MKQKPIYYNDHGGVYCFFPFERLDKKNCGVFKVGNTQQSFQERLASYHTYFVYGVWVICLIKVYAKRGKELPKDLKRILNTMEEYVIHELENEGSTLIVDERRRWKAGRSEWVFTNPYTVKKVFQKTILRFKKEYPDLGFLLDCADIPKTIKAIEKNYNKATKEKGKHMAEYIFNVDPKRNNRSASVSDFFP